MVVTQKVESESEETQERVRARAMVTTKPWEGMARLGQQISQLMAALTKTGQVSSPTSVPGSPQECGHGSWHSGRGTCSLQTLTTLGVSLAR